MVVCTIFTEVGWVSLSMARILMRACTYIDPAEDECEELTLWWIVFWIGKVNCDMDAASETRNQ